VGTADELGVKPVYFVVELEGRIFGDAGEDARGAAVDAHMRAVLDELHRLDATDPEASLDRSDGLVMLSVTVQAPNAVNAVERASALLRTAIHAAGGGTADWPAVTSAAWGISVVTTSIW